MQLSEFLGLAVHDAAGRRLGAVTDVRLSVAGDLDDHPRRPELFGLVVSPHTRSSYFGYERADIRGPALLAAALRWRHRGAFLDLWPDVGRVKHTSVALRDGFTRYSPLLRDVD